MASNNALKFPFAEPLVSFALDDFKKDRPNDRLSKDL